MFPKHLELLQSPDLDAIEAHLGNHHVPTVRATVFEAGTKVTQVCQSAFVPSSLNLQPCVGWKTLELATHVAEDHSQQSLLLAVQLQLAML